MLIVLISLEILVAHYSVSAGIGRKGTDTEGCPVSHQVKRMKLSLSQVTITVKLTHVLFQSVFLKYGPVMKRRNPEPPQMH